MSLGHDNFGSGRVSTTLVLNRAALLGLGWRALAGTVDLALANSLCSPCVGLDLGHEPRAIFFLGGRADQLELLLHLHGGEDVLGLGGLVLLQDGELGRVLGHPEEVFIREVGTVDASVTRVGVGQRGAVRP